MKIRIEHRAESTDVYVIYDGSKLLGMVSRAGKGKFEAYAFAGGGKHDHLYENELFALSALTGELAVTYQY